MRFKIVRYNIQYMDKEMLIETIREWLQIDNELKELQRASKERRKRKKELTTNLVEVMKTNEIDCFDVNGGKLIYAVNKTRVSLSKKHLLFALSNFYKDEPERVSDLSSFILNSREEKIKETIRRKKEK